MNSSPTDADAQIGTLEVWQRFLEWNRSQPHGPLVSLGSEFAVAQVVIRLYNEFTTSQADKINAGTQVPHKEQGGEHGILQQTMPTPAVPAPTQSMDADGKDGR